MSAYYHYASNNLKYLQELPLDQRLSCILHSMMIQDLKKHLENAELMEKQELDEIMNLTKVLYQSLNNKPDKTNKSDKSDKIHKTDKSTKVDKSILTAMVEFEQAERTDKIDKIHKFDNKFDNNPVTLVTSVTPPVTDELAEKFGEWASSFSSESE